ncbi:MAG: DUF5682 family protein [Saprospiraceae bacterium]
MSAITIFGIRHHGPGSAKRLLKALRELKPDCLLVEAPQDSEAQLQQILTKGFKPPVALLLYDPKDFRQASYLPFAEFSPEWQAIQYALKQEIPVRAMDLPMSIQLALKADTQLAMMDTLLTSEDQQLRRDPLGFMANIAGYDDSERWWEHTFEQEENDLAVFTGIQEIMRALRSETKGIETTETLLREAFMRKTLRKAQKDQFQNIAIVCGAWHGPAIEDYNQIKATSDNQLLRGLKKIKLKACWIPWSYERLAKNSGYGAGILSPAWYELIFSRRKETNIRWMTKAARLFRQKDLDSSSAHVIEAVRLADTLATLRGLQIPGIEELEEAAISIFCQGDTTPIELIRQQIVVGDTVGKVPAGLSVVPLQKDFQALVKKARLSNFYQSSEQATKEFDFRKKTQKAASILLHRLNLLGIPWGTLGKLSGRELGSFKEKWKLKWRPDYEIRIIQASMYGNTIEEACYQYAREKADQAKDLAPLLDLLDHLLKAELASLAAEIIPKMENLAARSTDILQLTAAVPQLIRILRYGSTRGLDTHAVQTLLEALLPRIFIGLPNASRHLEESAAKDIFQQILNIHSSLGLFDNPNFRSDWNQCLQQLTQLPHIHPLLQGISCRILFDSNHFSVPKTALQMDLALSATVEPSVKAMWLEGFLNGSALLIIYQPALWNILNQYIKNLPQEQLYESLPILRRTFAAFSSGERQQLMQLARQGTVKITEEEVSFNPEQAAMLKPFLVEMLSS